MKHIYLFLFCIIISTNAFSQDVKILPPLQAAWDDLYKDCGGEDWHVKTISDLENNSESPFIKFYHAKIEGAYSIETFDLSNNNLKGDVPATFIKNNDFTPAVVWPYYGSVKIILSHNEITSVPNGMGTCYFSVMHTVRIDNNKLTSFHTDDRESITGMAPNLYTGCRVFTIHQNDITSLTEDNLGSSSYGSVSLIDNKAEEIRIDNNRLDFKSLCEVVPFIKSQYRYINYAYKGNEENCYFDYYPQKPLGDAVSEVNADQGSTHELNFSLNHKDNVYSWMLNGKDVPLSEGKSYNFSLNAESAGVYICKITNKNLPEVTLYSKDMPVFMNKANNKVINDFQIIHDAITENFPEGAIVADFQGQDPDGDEVFYRLIDGEANNSSFRIKEGKTLVSSEKLFERSYLSEYKLVVEAYDVYGGKKQKEFTISKGEGGGTKLPEDITLSGTEVDENVADAVIGDLATVGVTGYSFSLSNDSDKEWFYIEGQSLKTKVGLDYETKKGYSVRVKASADDGTQMKKDFNISVNDVNDAPHQVVLTTDVAKINVSAGAFIGQLVAVDQDPDDIVFSYKLINGDGDTNNEDFVIQGNKLLSARKYTEIDLGQMSIRVEVKDDENAAYEQVIKVSVQGEITENKMPRGIGLSNTVLWNEFEEGDDIAFIYMSDPEGEEGTFTCDNKYVEVIGTKLRLIKIPEDNNFEVEITGNDGENSISSIFRFNREANETGLKSIELSNIKVYPNPTVDKLNFSEPISGQVYSLSGRLIKQFNEESQVVVSELEQGTYLLKIFTREGIFVSKFIKKL
ncbi:MAG: T9SS type A sorting domain-containing protein [Carboxylicivirga sp.]|jgi:hypothetical protein|nr:T9SS type A sorting domain-containing protein [Carboxylicivirga sp.]